MMAGVLMEPAAVPAILCLPQPAAMGCGPVCAMVAHIFPHQAALLLLLPDGEFKKGWKDSYKGTGEFLESWKKKKS